MATNAAEPMATPAIAPIDMFTPPDDSSEESPLLEPSVLDSLPTSSLPDSGDPEPGDPEPEDPEPEDPEPEDPEPGEDPVFFASGPVWSATQKFTS